jgi:hypothetical protein
LSFISADCAAPSRADPVRAQLHTCYSRRGEEEQENKKKKGEEKEKEKKKQVLCSVRAILMLVLKLMFITDYYC